MQIQWHWNVDKSIRYAVQHYQFEVGPSLVERFPSKVCDHHTWAAGGYVAQLIECQMQFKPRVYISLYTENLHFASEIIFYFTV